LKAISVAFKEQNVEAYFLSLGVINFAVVLYCYFLSEYAEQGLLTGGHVLSKNWLPQAFFGLKNVFEAWILHLLSGSGLGRLDCSLSLAYKSKIRKHIMKKKAVWAWRRYRTWSERTSGRVCSMNHINMLENHQIALKDFSRTSGLVKKYGFLQFTYFL